MTKTRSLNLLVFVGWTVFGLFMSTQSYVVRLQAGHPVSWMSLAMVEIPYGWLWALLTPLVGMLARRYPIGGTTWIRNVVVHLGAGLVFALLHDFIIGLLRSAVLSSSAVSLTGQLRWILSYFDYGVILYLVILLTFSAVDYYAKLKEKEIRASQLEGQLAQSALQALRMQLHPHFLFNTLNAISVLIGKNPDAAKHTIGTLSGLLRYSLETAGVQEVPLWRELEFLRGYLNIEQTRFGDRLTVTMDVEPATLDIMVPNFLLQPLVENAIRHGISCRQGPGIIAVRSTRENGMIHLEVRDNGKGLGDVPPVSEGVGVGNTRARLERLYGPRHRFVMANGEEGGVVVSIAIPVSKEAV